MLKERVNNTIRNVPDFPKPGINFKDITPILKDHELCSDIAVDFAEHFQNKNINAIVGVESRGFLFGMLLAQVMKVPFVAVRKKGKLPYKTISYSYDLEYGSAEIEMHIDAINENDNVLIHDDLLATGGTAKAAAELVKTLGGRVSGFCFVVGLNFLGGKEVLKEYSENIYNVIEY